MAVVPVTQSVLDLLRERRIFHSYDGADRWALQSPLAVHDQCEIEPYAQIFHGNVMPRALGAFSYSNSPFDLWMRVGRYCSIAQQVAVMGERHPLEWAATSSFFYQSIPGPRPVGGIQVYRQSTGMKVRPNPQGELAVVMGHDVWIGEQVMIKRGVTVGSGAVVGARSLVLEDIPPYAIAVGQPARVIRYRFDPELIARFLELEWWRFAAAEISALPMEEPPRFLDALAEKIERDEIRPMRPATLRFAEILAAVQAAG